MFVRKTHLSVGLMMASLSLTSTTTQAGLFNGCFGGGDSPRAISAETMQTRALKRAQEMGICYEAAICLARSERTLNRKQAASLLETIRSGRATEGTSYTRAYRQAMSLDDASRSQSALSLDTISQSGFLNFQETRGDNQFVHTAYVQVASDGEVYLYNANNMEIDLALSKDAIGLPERAGRANRYRLSRAQVDSLNAWLSDTGTHFYYTPASEVPVNLQHILSGAAG
ncbi:hypothetical protein [Vibrio aestuarianus]|uniref:DUF8038 domain-containing protein n=1 Tax=Vibrio aestuarianus TaxID=28171 RepID=A0A9X4IPZ6_9VIBR|nr:hypothetical protein [Vibrio aestuarianus]MDE1242321.1 hypothetical protein [Vibrio aestuarianus]